MRMGIERLNESLVTKHLVSSMDEFLSHRSLKLCVPSNTLLLSLMTLVTVYLTRAF